VQRRPVRSALRGADERSAHAIDSRTNASRWGDVEKGGGRLPAQFTCGVGRQQLSSYPHRTGTKAGSTGSVWWTWEVGSLGTSSNSSASLSRGNVAIRNAEEARFGPNRNREREAPVTDQGSGRPGRVQRRPAHLRKRSFITATDSSAVGQWKVGSEGGTGGGISLGRWGLFNQGRPCVAGPSRAEFPRSRFPGSRTSKGQETSWEADPIETGQRRPAERGSGAERGSLWRSARPREETTRPHNGLGRPRMGIRQGP
jgi:hypothetical protein